MAMPFTASQLQKSVQDDLSTCESLLSLLTEEQEALKKRDIDQVSHILDEKLPLLERLDSSAQIRQTWAKSANSRNDDKGWAEIIEELGNSDLKDEWQHLKSLYSDVRNQNEINGKLLSRHQATVTRLLDVMRGKTANPNLYNSTGYSSNQAQRNSIGEA